MADVIGVRKAVRRVRLDDEPGSPEFTLDLTDLGVSGKAERLRALWREYGDVQARLGAAGEGKPEGLLREAAAVYRRVIDEMLGEGAYEAIARYAAGDEGVPTWNVNLALTPVVLYLFRCFDDALTANRDEAVLKYLRGRDAADAL